MSDNGTYLDKLNRSRKHCLWNLNVLDLNFNSLTSLSFSLKLKMPNLTHIKMSHNRLKYISETAFHGLKLTHLDLSHNELDAVSRGMFLKLKMLTVLDLSYNNLSYLHSNLFDDLSDLESLNLKNNTLMSHTFTNGLLVKITNLKFLDISDNNMEVIDAKMFTHLTKLKVLNLKGNLIHAIIPESFNFLQSLTNIDLSNNKLISLHNNTLQGLEKVVVLNFAQNKIRVVDKDVFQNTPQLLQLNLSRNSLESIPDGMVAVPKLLLLDLSRNRIDSIHPESFTNLHNLYGISLKDNLISSLPIHLFKHSGNNLRIINLADNRISHVEYGTFNGLNHLAHLLLDNNRIDDISLLFSRLISLTHLSLSSNKITSIIASHFPLNLQEINLSKNKISYVGLSIFYNLRKLKKVDLSYNRLDPELSKSCLRVRPGLATKPELYLRGNLFSCSCRMLWLKNINRFKYQLGSMYVADLHQVLCKTVITNQFRFLTDVMDRDFICIFTKDCDDRLCECCSKYDDLTLCHCAYICPDQCLCSYDDPKKRIVVDCSNATLKLCDVPEDIPKGVTELYIRNSMLSKIKKEDFARLKALKVLDLNNNQINCIEKGAFHSLSDVSGLSLSNNRLFTLPKDLFDQMRSVESIQLDHNSLNDTFNIKIFKNNMFLKTLTLNNNNLNRITLADLDEHNQLVAHLNLSSNPWHCDCDYGPLFQQWVTRNAARIQDANDLKCSPDTIESDEVSFIKSSNVSMQRRSESAVAMQDSVPATDMNLLLIDFNFCFNNVTNFTIEKTKIETVESKIAINVSASMAALIVVALIVSLLCVHYWDYIKVYVFTHYGIRFSGGQEDTTKFYDAFVSFSSKDDSNYIIEIADVLEKQHPNYRLCIHFRDFLGGASIAEAIVEAVQLSRRTLILLSNSYLKSEWCNYEFQTAHHNLLKDKTNRVILVLLEDIDPTMVSSELKLYMKTNTYMKWGEPWFWDKLRYVMPDVKLDREDFYDMDVLAPENRPMNLLLPIKEDQEVKV